MTASLCFVRPFATARILLSPSARRARRCRRSERRQQEHERRCKSWRNGKHRDQWVNTLKQHAFPKIGDLLVSDITSGDVLTVLEPIWLAKAETASRHHPR